MDHDLWLLDLLLSDAKEISLTVCLLCATYVNRMEKICNISSLLAHTQPVAGGDYSPSLTWIGCLEMSLIGPILKVGPQLIWVW